jgi:hypothetical protein
MWFGGKISRDGYIRLRRKNEEGKNEEIMEVEEKAKGVSLGRRSRVP